MPHFTGMKQFTVPSLVLDPYSEEEEAVPPPFGITVDQLKPEELEPRAFYPNFMRPFPEEEEDDDLEPIWLVPGISPEPYWDYTMGLPYNFSLIASTMNKATKG